MNKMMGRASMSVRTGWSVTPIAKAVFRLATIVMDRTFAMESTTTVTRKSTRTLQMKALSADRASAKETVLDVVSMAMLSTNALDDRLMDPTIATVETAIATVVQTSFMSRGTLYVSANAVRWG